MFKIFKLLTIGAATVAFAAAGLTAASADSSM
jgi:hypothetical protein